MSTTPPNLYRLLYLLESTDGKRKLVQYKQDGMGWVRRGDIPVTPELIAELRAAVERQA